MHIFTNYQDLLVRDLQIHIRYGVVLKFYVFFLCIAVNPPCSLAHQFVHWLLLMFDCIVLNKKGRGEEKDIISYFFQLVYLVLLNLYFPVTDKWNFLLPLRETKCPLLIV